MVYQITKGIKISVKTKYEGTLNRDQRLFYNFGYFITIENHSLKTIQLKNRFWKILDSLNQTEYVRGEGVIGETPILQPDEVYTYRSFCLLQSQIGAMNGFYTMIDIQSNKTFKVSIPTFQLSTSASLN